MITDILDGINEAERHAEKIIAAAASSVAQIEKQTQIDIEALRAESEARIVASIKDVTARFEKKNADTEFDKILDISKVKQDAARKYIVAQFHKKFVGGSS